MSDYNPAPAQRETHPYQKLGGWLKLFVVWQFIGLAFILLSIFTKDGFVGVLREWASHPGAHGFLLLAKQTGPIVTVALYVAFAVRVIRRDPLFFRTRQLAIAVNAVTMLLNTANVLLFGLADYGIYRNKETYMLFLALTFLFGLILPMLYYTRSVRVRTYMGSDEYLRRAFFTKKVKGPQPAVPDAMPANPPEGENL